MFGDAFAEWQRNFSSSKASGLMNNTLNIKPPKEDKIDTGVVGVADDPLKGIDLDMYAKKPIFNTSTPNVAPVKDVPNSNLSVTKTDNDINKVHPIFKKFIADLKDEVTKDKVLSKYIKPDEIKINEGFRSQKRQEYLYSFGRTRKGKKITWTLHSRHNAGIAIDLSVPPKIAEQVKHKKYGVESRFLRKAYILGAKYGIGGIPKRSKDPYHFQLGWEYSLYRRKKGKRTKVAIK